jgi:hypothetical integral membrane protein (TIGR02206 family)
MTVLAAGAFDSFGTSHLVVLAVFVLGIWPVIALGRRVRGTADEMRVCRVYALLIPCFTIPLQVIDFLPGNYDLQTTLPLQLCDFASIAAVAALWTRRPTPVGLTYFWGLALTTQALITPALDRDFPDPKFIAYWGMHLLIVWAAVFLTWGLGLHPTWRDYRRTVAITATWAVAVFCFNVAVGTNYGFLNRKPATSILDLLGPWPLYVVVEIALVAGVWALMTWPWARARRTRHASLIAGE